MLEKDIWFMLFFFFRSIDWNCGSQKSFAAIRWAIEKRSKRANRWRQNLQWNVYLQNCSASSSASWMATAWPVQPKYATAGTALSMTWARASTYGTSAAWKSLAWMPLWPRQDLLSCWLCQGVQKQNYAETVGSSGKRCMLSIGTVTV